MNERPPQEPSVDYSWGELKGFEESWETGGQDENELQFIGDGDGRQVPPTCTKRRFINEDVSDDCWRSNTFL